MLAAVLALGPGGSPTAADDRPGAKRPATDVSTLLERLAKPDPSDRAAAARALGSLLDPPDEAVAALRGARADRSGGVQEAAFSALAAFSKFRKDCVGDVVEALSDREVPIQEAAVRAIAALPPNEIETRAEEIARRLDLRETQVVATVAGALGRSPAAATRMARPVVEAWSRFHGDGLSGWITTHAQDTAPLVADVLAGADAGKRRAAADLLARMPAEAVASQAERIVRTLLDRLPQDPPEAGKRPFAFTLLVRTAPLVPALKDRVVETAAAWVLDAHRISGGLADQAIREAFGSAPADAAANRLLLSVVRRWMETGATLPQEPALPQRPWVPWIGTLLQAVPDAGPDAEALLDAADESVVRWVATMLVGKPEGDALLHRLFASSDPKKRRAAVDSCRMRPPTEAIRQDLIRALRDPEVSLQEPALRAFFDAVGRAANYRWPDAATTFTDTERDEVVAVLAEWVSSLDSPRAAIATQFLAQMGPAGRAAAPALVKRLEKSALDGPDFWSLKAALTAVGGWDFAASILQRLRDDPNPRARAIATLGYASARLAPVSVLLPEVRACLESGDWSVAWAGWEAAKALGKDAAPLEAWFVKRAASADDGEAWRALDVLRSIASGSEAAFETARSAFARPATCDPAGGVLLGFGGRAVPVFEAAVADPTTRGAGLRGLSGLAPTVPEARALLEGFAASSDRDLQREAAMWLTLSAKEAK